MQLPKKTKLFTKRTGRGSQNVTFKIYGRVFLLSVDMYLSNSKTDIAVDDYTVVIHLCFSKSSILLKSAMQFQVSDGAFNESKSCPSLTLYYSLLGWFFNTASLSFQKSGKLRLSVFS